MHRSLSWVTLSAALLADPASPVRAPSVGLEATFELSTAAARKCDPILRRGTPSVGIGAAMDALSLPPLLPTVRGDDGAPRIPCWVRYSGAGPTPVRATLAEIALLAADPRVTRIQAATRTRPRLDASVVEIRADLAQDAIGAPPSYAGYAGSGVLIGIVDTGIDLEHEDFRVGTASRVLALWDQTVNPSVDPPSGFGYGREWTRAQIEAGASTQVDTEGHGTHVAGIAAGDGSATGNGQPAYRFVGVAPEAQLVIVKTDFYSTSVADAVEYVFRQATEAGLSAVVNLSLGHHYGPHDGTEETDLAIDELVGPGRIVIAAAGNEQEDAIHAEGAPAAGDSVTLTIAIAPYAPAPGADNDYVLIDGYYTEGTAVDLSVVTPTGARVGPISAGERVDLNTPDGGVYLENGWFDPATEDVNFFIQIYDPTALSAPATGTWSVVLSRPAARGAPSACRADLWLYATTLSSEPHFDVGASAATLISSPASADSVIAVAAYTTKTSWQSIDGNTYQYSSPPALGSIASFSSRGPRRDGALKPDIAAPGMGIAAPLSTDHPIPAPYVTLDGAHSVNQGTSMAAPHVAGVAALMLQAHGNLSKRVLLHLLGETARGDELTSALPNPTFGWGRIDASSATTLVPPVLPEGVTVTRTPEGIELAWSVRVDASNLLFSVTRQLGEERPAEIGRVGPGPRYSFVDAALVPSAEPLYWLCALDGSRETRRLGPFRPAGSAPSRFALAVLGPNPALREATCRLIVPSTRAVSLDVLGVDGRRVRSLHSGELPAGTHVLRWDGRRDDGGRAASGVYWLRGAWEGRVATGRVLLVQGD